MYKIEPSINPAVRNRMLRPANNKVLKTQRCLLKNLCLLYFLSCIFFSYVLYVFHLIRFCNFHAKNINTKTTKSPQDNRDCVIMSQSIYSRMFADISHTLKLTKAQAVAQRRMRKQLESQRETVPNQINRRKDPLSGGFSN